MASTHDWPNICQLVSEFAGLGRQDGMRLPAKLVGALDSQTQTDNFFMNDPSC